MSILLHVTKIELDELEATTLMIIGAGRTEMGGVGLLEGEEDVTSVVG